MNIEHFGEQLLATGDLDPIYVMLHHSKMERDQLQRWCLSYWMCYHAGVSSWMSEHQETEFWVQMRKFAENATLSPLKGRWPRGTERRHFRGISASSSVDSFAYCFPAPELAVIAAQSKAPDFARVRRYVMTWPQFGPWIAFKVGDMLGRVLGVHVDFSNSDVFMFDSPREAAEMLTKETGQRAVEEALTHLRMHLGRWMAPPCGDRRVNLQEYETILCKWKSHVNGHYEVGKDIHEIRHALTEWREVSPTAGRLLESLDAHTRLNAA